MSDMQEEPAQEQETKLTSDQFEEFNEALEVLYVMANISGRNNFAKEWPQAAAYLFGPELTRYDEEGAQGEEEREKRAELEVQAEEKRLALLESLDGLEDKSVKSGVLQVEHVKAVVEQLGRELALHVYSAQIVDRFIPPPPEEKNEGTEEGAPTAPAEDLSEQAAEEVPEIQPIDAGVVSPVSEQPAPVQQPSAQPSEDVSQPPAESAAPVSTPAAPPPPPVVSAPESPVAPVSEKPVTPTPVDPPAEPLQPETPPAEQSAPSPVGAPTSPQPVEAPVPPPAQPETPPPVSQPVSPPPQAVETPQTEPTAPNTQRPVSMQFVPSEKKEGEGEKAPSEKQPEGE